MCMRALPGLLSHSLGLSGGHRSGQAARFFPEEAGVGQGSCWPHLFPGQTVKCALNSLLAGG